MVVHPRAIDAQAAGSVAVQGAGLVTGPIAEDQFGLTRAFDPVGNAQPLDGSIRWNPSGYEWHGADYVDVTVA